MPMCLGRKRTKKQRKTAALGGGDPRKKTAALGGGDPRGEARHFHWIPTEHFKAGIET